MKCRICGKGFDERQYGEPYSDICSQECFDKNFWIESENSLSDRSVVINNQLYYIGDEDNDSSFRGHAGELFVIKKPDGTVVRTTNLWYNGSIPEEIRGRFPENSEVFPDDYKGKYVVYNRGGPEWKEL